MKMQGTNRSRVGGEEPAICELRLGGEKAKGEYNKWDGTNFIFKSSVAKTGGCGRDTYRGVWQHVYIYDFLGRTLMFPFERAMSNSKETAEEPTMKCDTDKPLESVIVFEHI